MKYIIPADLTLLEALALFAPESSKNTLRQWIKEGRVQIDAGVAKNASLKVFKNQTLTFGPRKKMIRHDLPILYEDEDLVIIHKPSGLLSVATAFEKGETVQALLKEYYFPRQTFVVHRLDQDTSGVMVFALHTAAQEKLKKMFEVHAIERSYTAIVEGKLLETQGTWQSYQYEDSQYKVHETSDPTKGRLAVTHYKLIATSRYYSWLELKLETGRKNQIRVHCQSAGHSVVGDKKYGSRTNPLKRLCLHAHLLAFQHPFTKKQLRFETSIPTEFYRLMPSLLSS